MCIIYFLWVFNLQHFQYLARYVGASSKAQTYYSLIPFTSGVIFFLAQHSIVIKWRKVHTVATLRTCIPKEETVILAFFLMRFQTTVTHIKTFMVHEQPVLIIFSESLSVFLRYATDVMATMKSMNLCSLNLWCTVKLGTHHMFWTNTLNDLSKKELLHRKKLRWERLSMTEVSSH